MDDVDASYKTLQRSPWGKDDGLLLGPPEEWSYGPQFGTRTVLNFTNPEGVFFQLHAQPRPNGALHP